MYLRVSKSVKCEKQKNQAQATPRNTISTMKFHKLLKPIQVKVKNFKWLMHHAQCIETGKGQVGLV